MWKKFKIVEKNSLSFRVAKKYDKCLLICSITNLKIGVLCWKKHKSGF